MPEMPYVYKVIYSVTHFWDGSWAKYSLAFLYEIGLSPSIKSDKSMSNVGLRLLNSEPYDTWHDPDSVKMLMKSQYHLQNGKYITEVVKASDRNWQLRKKFWNWILNIIAVSSRELLTNQRNSFTIQELHTNRKLLVEDWVGFDHEYFPSKN